MSVLNMRYRAALAPFCRSGEVSIIIGGSFGSEYKGGVASYLSKFSPADIVAYIASASAAHTFEEGVAHQLPVAGIRDRRSTMYLVAGAIIDPERLIAEIKHFDIDPDRLVISPMATVICEHHKEIERENLGFMASTAAGSVPAYYDKLMRKEGALARNHPLLKPFCHAHFDLMRCLDDGCSALLEVPQGFGLSLNHGAYPYVTAKDITVANALALAGVHPSYLGEVCMVTRRYPIRVAHKYDENGDFVGSSGPFPRDSKELTFEELGLSRERTTYTGNFRRIGDMSLELYRESVHVNRPDLVAMTFCDYPHVQHGGTVGAKDMAEDALPLLVESLAGERFHPKAFLLSFGKDPEAFNLISWGEAKGIVRKMGYENLCPAV